VSVRPLTPMLTVLAALLLLASSAYAGNDWMPPVRDATVKKECGTCHMAFQPGFLPARSWTRMMGNLADHFGEDVSLPDDKIEIIRAYLTANAGDVVNQGRAAKYMQWVTPGGTPQRITENPDFVRKHRFPDLVWNDPKVVTRSNCLACHVGAERGLYE
jgi:hypothetical protein